MKLHQNYPKTTQFCLEYGQPHPPFLRNPQNKAQKIDTKTFGFGLDPPPPPSFWTMFKSKRFFFWMSSLGRRVYETVRSLLV